MKSSCTTILLCVHMLIIPIHGVRKRFKAWTFNLQNLERFHKVLTTVQDHQHCCEAICLSPRDMGTQ